jgi:hypothetical protein
MHAHICQKPDKIISNAGYNGLNKNNIKLFLYIVLLYLLRQIFNKFDNNYLSTFIIFNINNNKIKMLVQTQTNKKYLFLSLKS